MGKWYDGRYHNLDAYSKYNDTWKPGQYFDLKVTVASITGNGQDKATIHSYLDDGLLGVYEDTASPFMNGSVGLRNYNLPAKYKNYYVHFLNDSK